MKRNLLRWVSVICILLFTHAAFAGLTKGIYLTQSTVENTDKLTYLITQAKMVGINTFIADLDRPSKKYQKNIALIKSNNIAYVARVVIFPNGGTPEQVRSRAYWDKKYQLIQTAVSYGANEIQLDYIRYYTKQPSSSQNAKDIYNVIRYFKDKLVAYNVPLQIDVFGIASFGESKHIGHNIKLFQSTIDVLCPMVYPSHYQPFSQHAAAPYETVFGSLMAIKSQFGNNPMPFKLRPYIELSNYHYLLSKKKKLDYIYAQIRAVQNAGADGWYAWSPNNLYDNLFLLLKSYPVR